MRLCRWEEHFKELLNHAASGEHRIFKPDTSASENCPCGVDPPVCTVVRQLRNNNMVANKGQGLPGNQILKVLAAI